MHGGVTVCWQPMPASTAAANPAPLSFTTPPSSSSYYYVTRRGARDDHVAGIASCVLAAVVLIVRLYVVPQDNC